MFLVLLFFLLLFSSIFLGTTKQSKRKRGLKKNKAIKMEYSKKNLVRLVQILLRSGFLKIVIFKLFFLQFGFFRARPWTSIDGIFLLHDFLLLFLHRLGVLGWHLSEKIRGKVVENQRPVVLICLNPRESAFSGWVSPCNRDPSPTRSWVKQSRNNSVFCKVSLDKRWQVPFKSLLFLFLQLIS